MEIGLHWMIRVQDGEKIINGISCKNIIFKQSFYRKKNMLLELEKVKKKYQNKEIKIFQKINSKWCEYPDV